MPELPEVEVTARSLRRWLSGERIERAESTDSRVFRDGDRRRFERELSGRRLVWLERRGKWLLLGFDGGVGLVSHLGMTGKWVRAEQGEAGPTHSRAKLFLRESGATLHYQDPRQFGRLEVMGERELWGIPVIQSMGPDPLLDGVNASVLRKALADTSRPVKVALMDPEVIAGIGNIQATEALFRAEIHPARPANSLSSTEVRAVAKGIRRSIEYTLTNLEKPEAAGRVEYVSAGGDNPFLIYDRAGEPCPRCGTELEKMTLGGRTTVYCLVCQR